MAKQVTSPAGETIEIVPDQVYADAVGVPIHALGIAWKSRAPMFGALWLYGAAQDKSGFATSVLSARARALGSKATAVTSITGSINSAVNTLCFARKINGRKCYEIKLVAMPERIYKRVVDQFGTQAPKVAEPELVDLDDETTDDTAALAEVVDIAKLAGDSVTRHPANQPPEDVWEPRPLELNIATLVAMQLLDRVVDIASTGKLPASQDSQRLGKVEADLREVEHRLAMRLDENTKLRRQLTEAGDMIRAHKVEADGLRARLRIAEHNLSIAGSADTQRLVTQQVRAELAKIMSAKPGPNRDTVEDRAL